jgi:predicted alpha/beta hydrolase
MGVRQDYYAPFAQWLAGQGWRVTTFDYRGSGDSLPDTPAGGLRGYKADLFDWTRDYEAAIDHAHGRCRASRCTCWATAWAPSCRA